MILEQIGDGFDGDRPHLGGLGENVVKRADLQRVVQRDRDHMDRGSVVPQLDVAALLTDHAIAEPLQCENYAICGYASTQFRAASTGINSSFT